MYFVSLLVFSLFALLICKLKTNALQYIKSKVRAIHFSNFIVLLALYYSKVFYETNYFFKLIFCNLDKFYINSTMTGITLLHKNARPPLHFIQNLSEYHSCNVFLPNAIK